MKKILILIILVGAKLFAAGQTPILEELRLRNVPYSSSASVVHIGIDTCASCPTKGMLYRQTAGGVGGGGGTVTAVAAGYGTVFSTITSSGSVVIDTFKMATRPRVQKAVDSLGNLLGGFISNTTTLQSSSNFHISGIGRIAGELHVVDAGYSDQGVYKIQTDGNVLIYGLHSDNTSKGLTVNRANGGESMSVDNAGYSSFLNIARPTVHSNFAAGFNGGVYVGDDGGGVLWLNRYSSSEPYAEIYASQARNSLGTSGIRLFTASSGSSVNALSIEAAGAAKFITTVSPQSDDGAPLGSTSLKWSDLFLASGAVINFNSGNATLTHSSGLLTSNVDVVVPDEAYDATAWNGSLEVPTKNAIRDKIEAMTVGTAWNGHFNGTIESTGTSYTLDAFPVAINAASSAATWTLPDRATYVGDAYFVKNASAFNLTVQRSGSDQIYSSTTVTSIVLAPGESRLFIAASSYWYSYYEAGSGSGITIGSTTVTSGTNTRILYNNAGTVGQYNISGAGDVVMTNGATFVSNVRATSSAVYYLGGNLSSNTTDVGNVGAGEDDLMTSTIFNGMLGSNGDYLEFTMTFDLAANSNNKQVKVKFGGTTIYASGAQAQNDGVIEITGTIIRTGSATQRISYSVSSSGSLFPDYADYVTATETMSSGIILKATGEATSTDDIIQRLMIVKYFPGN